MSGHGKSEQLQDMVVGAAMTVLGACAIYLSAAYRGGAGHYPGTLGAALAVLGLFLTVRSARNWRVHTKDRPLTASPYHFFVTLAVTIAYLAAIPFFGFFTSSLTVLISLPLCLGFRRMTLLLIAATLFTAVIYGTFSLVLKRPLPAEIFLR